MNNEIHSKLTSALDILNNIEVRGKDNLINILGCITLIGDIQRMIIKESDVAARSDTEV